MPIQSFIARKTSAGKAVLFAAAAIAGLIGAAFACGGVALIKVFFIDRGMAPSFRFIDAWVGWPEILAIMPWLVATAYLHSVMVQERARLLNPEPAKRNASARSPAMRPSGSAVKRSHVSGVKPLTGYR